MVGREGQQNAVHEQDVLEVVDDALAVEEVHGRSEKVPVQRLGKAQATVLAGHIGYGDDLLEGHDL